MQRVWDSRPAVRAASTVGKDGAKLNLTFLRTVVGTHEVIGKWGVLDIQCHFGELVVFLLSLGFLLLTDLFLLVGKALHILL